MIGDSGIKTFTTSRRSAQESYQLTSACNVTICARVNEGLEIAIDTVTVTGGIIVLRTAQNSNLVTAEWGVDLHTLAMRRAACRELRLHSHFRKHDLSVTKGAEPNRTIVNPWQIRNRRSFTADHPKTDDATTREHTRGVVAGFLPEDSSTGLAMPRLHIAGANSAESCLNSESDAADLPESRLPSAAISSQAVTGATCDVQVCARRETE
ncbi:uncharacterized protein F5147DRAFT_652996 [Suillus discolor]|uniref:Uncharacterized protein n=1 Tax=Suillus discolor TaxID=1912936 RepID=A0A9P7JTS7_9AGAM|nr:uncharacterized protein F5147DRAFT_652996 [Suillus discolor]KAG2107884.1 hypothetical protein F5147DRAFT_652996 [Suillus discolor]